MALNLAFKGFSYSAYYNGAYENADSLAALASTGANALSATIEYNIDPATDQIQNDATWTDLAGEGPMIAEAVGMGLSVMVRPTIDFLEAGQLGGTPFNVGSWRSYFNPGAANSAGANAFFASYKTMILQQAQIAVANGATSLCIGTEIDQLTGPSYKAYWDDIIKTLRTNDPSLKLTYAADWNSDVSPWTPAYSGVATGLPAGTGNLSTQISFASELDYFGVDCYAPLSNAANPTLQQLIDGWTQTPVDSGATAASYQVTGGQSLIAYYESVAAAVGKPLIFTELGYENATDAAAQPFGSATNVEADALQAQLYQAFFNAWAQAGNSTLTGVYFWNWDPNAAEVGPGSVAFSPQNLPAQTVIANEFAAPGLTAPASLGSGLNITVAVGGVSLSGAAASFSVSLTAAHGLLFASGGATIQGAGTGALTISGALAAVNATLANLQYEATSAANDTIAISAGDGGVDSATGSISVVYDSNFPVLSFTTVGPLVNGATISVAGTINASDAGLSVTLARGGGAIGSTTANGGGNWSLLASLNAGFQILTASATDAAGNTGVSSPLGVALGGGVAASFSAANGDAFHLYATAGNWDEINGSNGSVILHAAQADIAGGGDQIYADTSTQDAVSLSGTNGVVDVVTGSFCPVTLDNAQAMVAGYDNVMLKGVCALSLAQTSNGVISGFSLGDTIDLATLTYKSSFEAGYFVKTTGATLEILDSSANNGMVASLNFADSLSGAAIALSSDGKGGTFISLTAAPWAQPQAGDALFTQIPGQAYFASQSNYTPNALNPGYLGENFYAKSNGGVMETDYDSEGRQARVVYYNDSSQPAAISTYDFVGGLYSGGVFTYTSVPAGAGFSSYTIQTAYTGAFAGASYQMNVAAGSAWSGDQLDLDASGALSAVILSGFQGQPYNALRYDFSGGALADFRVTYNSAASYSALEEDFTATNQLTKVVYSGLTATPYSTLEEDFSAGALSRMVFGYTNVNSNNMKGYHVIDDGLGNALQEIVDQTDGGHQQLALSSGQTLTALGDDVMSGSGATIFAFNAIYGAETITNFGAGDMISLPLAEFASFNALLAAAKDSGGGVVISAADGDSLTLQGLTKATLTGMAADFTFHT